MELMVSVEKASPIVRKLTVKVPAKEVATRFERGLAEVQKTAKLKGFRPGQVPISIVKQYYGEDVKHRVFHTVIDESYEQAVRDQKLKAVGRPKIDTPDHQKGKGDHDHGIDEGQDLTYVATVEVLPELEVKGYTGVALSKDKVEVTDEDVEKVVENLRGSQAELVPVGSGLVGADGKSTSRPAKKGDHVDVQFDGGLVTDQGVERKEGMKGQRVIEIGSDSLIPGFEDNLVGMRSGDTKTFRLNFPKDYFEADMAGKESEFTVTLNEVKEKKLPELNDEWAKQAGYESVSDLRTKAKDFLGKERTEQADRKLRSELISALIEKNPFDVPTALVEAQTRALAQDWGQELKGQGFNEEMIQQAVGSELENIRKRAESQVRASLILEAIAAKEKVTTTPEQIDEEVTKLAKGMNVEEAKLRDYYAKNPGRKEDLEFRLRQDSVLKFLLDKAKIKAGSKEK